MKMKMMLVAAFVLSACTSRTTGNEGVLVFEYSTDDDFSNFNKPIAVGAHLDIRVRQAGTLDDVTLQEASTDDEAVLTVAETKSSVLSQVVDTVVVKGIADGSVRLQVKGELRGEILEDSVDLLVRTPEVLVLRHTCTADDRAAYISGTSVVVGYDLELLDGQSVIGDGFYPVTSTDNFTFDAASSGAGFLAFRSSSDASGSATISSTIDATTLAVALVSEADIDDIQDPIGRTEVESSDDAVFFVRPMSAGNVVCQSRAQHSVGSDTPTICNVSGNAGDGDNLERGFFKIEGLSEGSCQYTVQYPAGAAGAGVSKQFTIEIVAPR